MIRSFHHSEFALERLLEEKRETITVVLPAREVADTIGAIVDRLRGVGALIDQILVVDAASEDGTAEVAPCGGPRRSPAARWSRSSTPTRATSRRTSPPDCSGR